jgi:predicted alpha/beta superfamily hydrolase
MYRELIYQIKTSVFMEIILFLSSRKRLLLLISLLFASLIDVASQDKVKLQGEDFPMVSVPNTELRTFYSKIMKQEMIIYIKLPVTYYTDNQKVYSALYFTDANRSFPMVANMVSIFEVPLPAEPEIVIIGIGYKIKDMADWGAWRTRDLTPTNVPAVDTTWNKLLSGITGRQFDVKSGGAATFLDFIGKEVIPFVESNYRVSPANRGIGGYSYGGLFSLYVLFKQPDLFNIYYAGSPSISFDNGILFKYEKEYASSHKDLNVNLFMSAGGSEDSMMVSNVNKMANLLQSRNYSGLKVETHVFPEESHQSCYPSSIMRALRVLYKRQ